MKTLVNLMRIAAILFYSFLYFILKFDVFSCLVGTLIVFAITMPLKNKKSEAVTPDF